MGVADTVIYDPLAWLKELEAQRGYDAWLSTQNQPELPASTTPKPTTTTTTPSGSSSGSSGAANPGLSPYIQDYRLNFFPQGDPPASLLSKAKANNWSIAYWRMQVRMNDPKYWRSMEAKQLLPDFNRTMRILFPGLANKAKQAQLMKSNFYRQQAMWYLKNGIGLQKGAGAEALYGHITQTARWNKANPYWKAYSRNANIGVVSEANPLLYKQYLETLKQSYGALGMTSVPEDYYRTFFRSRYASEEGMKEFGENLKLQYQAGPSMGWFQGQAMDAGQVKSATMGTDQQAQDLRSRLSKAFNVRGSFLSSQQKGFDTAMSKGGNLVNPLI